jgi:tetratricopeptide (TPR) repeat protein
MKKTITLFLLILCVQISEAQNRKLDSLNILISRAASDTERIKLKLSKVNLLNRINIDSSIAFTVKTLERTGIDYYNMWEFELRLGLIYNYAFKGNYKAAADQIDYLQNYIRASEDSMNYGTLYSSRGLLYGMQSKYDSSILYYEKAIPIYERYGTSIQLGSTYSNNAIGYQQISNFPMALFYFQKSLKVSEENNNEVQQAYSTLNIANTYSNMGDSVRAEIAFLKALKLAEKLKLIKVELYVYTNLSSQYIKQEKWQKAYESALKASGIGGSMGDQGIEAASLSKAAISLTMLNEPEKAIKIAEKSIAVADSSGQPFNISQANASMGFAFRYMKKWAEAIPYYEKSFSAVEDADIYIQRISG